MNNETVVERMVEHWAQIERNAMPAFFRAKDGLDAEDMYRHARFILRDVSFLTPHYMHGWALGVEGRKFEPKKTLNFANEFETGYITGWCQMDNAMKREGIE